MHVTRIKIKNLLGIEELEIKPGRFNEIRGKNGSGKTSVLESIKAAIKGGHDATLLRAGAEKGEVVLILDNGDEIEKSVTSAKSETKIRHDGKLVRATGSFLDDIRDITSVNPVEFIYAEPKRRLEILLDSLTFDVTSQELTEAAGFQCEIKGNPLDCIGTVRKAIYDERTGLNRAEKEKRSTLNQLSESVPPSIAGDPEAELGITNDLVVATQRMHSEDIAKGEDARAKRFEELDEWRRQEIEKINARVEAEKAKAIAANNEWRKSCDEKFLPGIEKAKAQQATLTEQIRTKASFEQQARIIEQMDAEVQKLKEEAESKSEAIARLDALRNRLLENMPFKGLVVQDGEIYIEGIAFDRINSSDQVRFVLQLAALRAGDLKLVCVDGLEMIDPDRYLRFVEAAKKMDLQFFVTRVTGEEFTVETEA